MLIQLNTTTDRLVSVPGRGNFLYVESATGAVRIIVVLMNGNRADYTLEGRSQLRFDEDIRELELENLFAGNNTVELVTGYGEFLPNNDGQRVTLTGQDLAIEIQTPAGQPIAVESTLANPVVIVAADLGTSNDASAATDNGNFSLISLFKRLLGKVPNKGQVTMANSLPVTIASNQSAVPVSGVLTDTELRAAPVPVSGPATAAQIDALTLDVQQVLYGTNTAGNKIVGSGTIAAKATRKYLILKPLRTNTGIGWLDSTPNKGVALEGGDSALILETTAAVNIDATVGTDVFTFTEIEV